MNDVTIKKRIEDALHEPRAPEELVRQTVFRAQGITAGREAEQRLEREGDKLPREEMAYLMAAGLIGRLAMTTPLPEGPSVQAMAKQLANDPRLQQRLNRPVEENLGRLRSGALLGEFAPRAPSAGEPEQAPAPAPERNGPAPPGM